jgi:outer membrane receptor protein involved in Fe transport
VRSGYASKLLDYRLLNQVAGLGEVPVIFSESRQQSFFNTALYQYDFSSQFSLEGAIAHQYHRVVSADTVAKTGYREKQNALSWMVAMRRNFGERLNLNLILRHENVDGKTMPVVPFFGFDFLLLKENPLILKGNVARNFRRPALNDLFWQPGGNPNLKVEDGFGFELGLLYQFEWQNQQIETEVTAFRNDIKNWIIWLPGYKGYWEPQNISNVLTGGIEANLIIKGALGKVGYHFTGNYAFTRAINYGDPLVWGDRSYGKQLVYIPVHSGNFMAAVKWRDYFISFQHNAYSERFTTSSNDVALRHRLHPYFMNDMIFGREFEAGGMSFSAELKVYNIFDESYRSVLYRPMPGRNFLVLLTMKI